VHRDPAQPNRQRTDPVHPAQRSAGLPAGPDADGAKEMIPMGGSGRVGPVSLSPLEGAPIPRELKLHAVRFVQSDAMHSNVILLKAKMYCEVAPLNRTTGGQLVWKRGRFGLLIINIMQQEMPSSALVALWAFGQRRSRTC
jgi:hypothetical protein